MAFTRSNKRSRTTQVGKNPVAPERPARARKVTLPAAFTADPGALRRLSGLTQAELGRVTGYSVRSIAAWENAGNVSHGARQKLTEVQRLLTALGELIPPGTLGDWLRSPNAAFEGQTPIQLIERGEADRLWRMIFQIDAGVAN